MGGSSGIVAEFQSLRAQVDADLLAMQVGDFYEFFGEDARRVHEMLDLKLSEKPSGGDRHAMAGVPVAEIDRYVSMIVDRGHRVAVATQRAEGNGHERAIDRVVTPGTHLDGDAGGGYLVAVAREETTVGIALVDVTTGQCLVDRPHEAPDADAVVELLDGLDTVEVIVGPDVAEVDALGGSLRVPVREPDGRLFRRRRCDERVREHLGSTFDDALELEAVTTRALGAALGYVETNDEALLASVSRVSRYRTDDTVTLDGTTQRNLEVTETFTGDREGSLLGTIDHTVTAGGGRLLRERLCRPTRDVDALQARLDAVEALLDASLVRPRLRETLKPTYDLARLATRCAHGSATPADLAKVRDTLSVLPTLREHVAETDALGEGAVEDLLALDDAAIETVRGRLRDALVATPPASATDGGIFEPGWDDTLDGVIEEHDRLATWFDDLDQRESDRHGFTSVTVDRTRAEGYYIQIPGEDADRVPEDYEHVKTVAAGRRYRTDELAEHERRYLELEERRSALEREAFASLVAEVAEAADDLRACGRALAALDVAIALATHAARHDWVRPQFRSDGVIEIDRGRHPVVEGTTRFVPNDCRLDDEREQLLVTGPNMSGKSTYLRQVALIALLAQVGAYVPADRAAITPVDGIFTRVGALDELAQGRSTFMVEMQELARILHQATADSLVILDEVGRGTATYDGMSIAWAAMEYLHTQVGARVLFATHFHELTVLADHLAGVANLHVAVDDDGDDVVFLREVEPGAADRSYGVHVAELAGVPAPVVERADEVLDRLREDKAIEARGHADDGTQVVFDLEGGVMRPAGEDGVDGDEEAVLEALQALDLEATAPLDLLERMRAWQDRLESG